MIRERHCITHRVEGAAHDAGDLARATKAHVHVRVAFRLSSQQGGRRWAGRQVACCHHHHLQHKLGLRLWGFRVGWVGGGGVGRSTFHNLVPLPYAWRGHA